MTGLVQGGRLTIEVCSLALQEAGRSGCWIQQLDEGFLDGNLWPSDLCTIFRTGMDNGVSKDTPCSHDGQVSSGRDEDRDRRQTRYGFRIGVVPSRAAFNTLPSDLRFRGVSLQPHFPIDSRISPGQVLAISSSCHLFSANVLFASQVRRTRNSTQPYLPGPGLSDQHSLLVPR